MMKPILIQKIFSGKRGEVWVCDKAGRVTASGKVVHGDRCFIGEFRVGRVQRFQSVRSALEWFGHKLFLPGSPSLESTLLFYYKLFTGQQPVMSEALVWDQEEGRTFRAWEDTNEKQYIVHDDGNAPWTHPQEQARIKQEGGGKKVKKPRKEAKSEEAEVKYKVYTIASGKNVQLKDVPVDPSIVVLGAVTWTKTVTRISAGSTAFLAVFKKELTVFAVTNIVLDQQAEDAVVNHDCYRLSGHPQV
jgi:hypothetical protein